MKLIEHLGINKRQQALLLVPSRYFFTEYAELPAGIEKADIQSFAEFTLEEKSPFPLEQLAWGYLSHPDSSHILIYAAYKPRLRADGVDGWDGAQHALPAFASVYGLNQEEHACKIVQYKQSLSIVFIRAGRSVPSYVESIEIEGDADLADAVFVARDELLAHIDTSGWLVDSGIMRVTDILVEPDGALAFQHEHLAYPDSEAKVMPTNNVTESDALWKADIRDEEWEKTAQQERKIERLIWRSMKLAGWAAIVMLVLQLFSFIADIWVDSREKTIQNADDAVTRVEQSQDFLATIRLFQRQGLRPFDMLTAMNQERPETIYFKSASTNEDGSYTIQGFTPSVSEVNAYRDKLQNTGKFEPIPDPKVKTQNSRVTFTLNIKPSNSVTAQPTALPIQ